MFAAVDLGNTALKVGAFRGRDLVATERFDVPRSLAEDVIPSAHFVAAEEAVVLASSPRRLAEFLAWTPREVRVLGDEVRASVPTSYRRPSDLGLDRIAAALGAREITGAARVVVADAGTAITVDALDADGRLLAVAIAPGLRAAADGLRAAAPHLPLAGMEPDALVLPAQGTADSLRTGLMLGVAGLVDRLVHEALVLVSGTATVVLTGGDAAALSPHLRTGHVVEPHAVLHGIRVLAAAAPR